jgi:SAM-dependent methyltransferase
MDDVPSTTDPKFASFPLVCTANGRTDGTGEFSACHHDLRQRDAETLWCPVPFGCGAEYRIVDGIPRLLAYDNPVGAASYDNELLAQAYVEMNFASYRTEAAPLDDDPVDPTSIDDLSQRLLNATDLTGPYYRHLTQMVMNLEPDPGGLIADIACGMGRMAPELHEAGWRGRYFGADLSPRLVRQASDVFLDGASAVRFPGDPQIGPTSTLTTIDAPTVPRSTTLLAVADAGRLALANDSCAVVLALNLVDRVPDPAAVVKELWRCVAPGGHLVLSDPFHWEGTTPVDREIYSFDRVNSWLADATPTGDPVEVVYAVRRRESRRIVIYRDLVASFTRVPRPS